MKCVCTLLLAAASAAAQQTVPANPPGQPDMPGRVAGHIFCSDTGKPARFATIQLMSEQSAKTPMFGPSQLGALTGSAGGKDGKGDLNFGAVLAQAMTAMMKGSNLSTITAMDGSFSLDKVPPGTYYVIPQLPGYLSPIGQLSQKQRLAADKDTIQAVESKAQKVVVAPGSTANLDVELNRGAVIGGTVSYDDGSPAPNVTPVLMLLGQDGKWKDLPSPSMVPSVTDDQGRYRVSGLPAGQYAIKAALPTTSASMGIGSGSLSMHMNLGDAMVVYSGGAMWMKDVKPVKLSEGDTRDDIDITFPISGLNVISGAVVAKSDGHRVNFGTVELQDPANKTVKLRTTILAKDGSFQFNYVPNGAYRLQVTSSADMGGGGDTDPGNPLGILLSGKAPKSFKEYGESGMMLTLPGNSEGLTLQVTDAAK
jgi:hypothetical protein